MQVIIYGSFSNRIFYLIALCYALLEYLEEEYNDDNNPLDENNFEEILPAIKKTIAAQKQLAINVDRIIKYDIHKKTGKVLEVQCTTDDGNVIYVEMEESSLSKVNIIFLLIICTLCIIP